LFALQAAENLTQRQAGFAADRAESDDKVVWDEAEEAADASSLAAVESSSTTQGDEGNDELVDSGEPLVHSSKFPNPSLLRDWSDDDDGGAGSAATLGGVALHVAAAAAGAQAPPIVDLPGSPEQCSIALESADPEEAEDDLAGAKRKAQPASSEPADKRKKPEPAVQDLHRPKMKKVAKRQATAVARWISHFLASHPYFAVAVSIDSLVGCFSLQVASFCRSGCPTSSRRCFRGNRDPSSRALPP
jgi:hypothetical protein